ncbi:hypothetical protein [Chitinophaga nivalis]|uniref:SRPBCC domain-containing protein n=1 Tax=Chitinophaga nivalis TaxID=2991709 RepID=A0ABT3IEU1_9BACT|nr:hypothetical protein [Chitinophaga nivalis]MCW3467833.1 hypothetical protein [Chitinophaga nivalis]MCW3482475.1 hypothetical protein [Chitinophaga nivalis]
MTHQEMRLNIRYDAPEAIWNKLSQVYEQLDGWIGHGRGGEYGEAGIPYWFSFNENEKHILVSVEPGGIQFSGLMDASEWAIWGKEIKKVATSMLGYKVGEIETGEVDY